MDFLNALYKKYNQNQYINYFAVLIISLGYIFLAPSQGCPVNWDCNAYIKMVDSIAYDSSVLPHHAMRILPAIIINKIINFFDISIETSFKLLSGLSYLLFSLGFYYVLNKLIAINESKEKFYALGITFIAMASHHAIIQALVNVYQSTDALTYPIFLLLFYYTYYKKQFNWVFILTIIGLLTRQNLFFAGILCLLFGLIHHKKYINIIYIILSTAAYTTLVKYYHAQGMLLATITPLPNFFTIKHILYVIQDSGILSLIIPISPILIFVIKEAILFYIKNWYLLLYSGITIGQPFLAYHLTGNNFERIAMQGVWPLYLISGMLFYEKYIQNKNKSIISFILFFYGAGLLIIMKFLPIIAEPLRLSLSILTGLILLVLLYFKQSISGKQNNLSAIN